MKRDVSLLARVVDLNRRHGDLLRWPDVGEIGETATVPSRVRTALHRTTIGQKLSTSLDRLLRAESLQARRVFLAHGFSPDVRHLVDALKADLRARGMKVVTGEKPAPTSVSKKVLDRIDSSAVFVALFTAERDDRVSPWIVSELGYAARRPRVVLLESGINHREIGGIQGDVEYIRFRRERPAVAFRRAAQSATRRTAV